MKKSFTTEAINLKNYPLNDNDSIVVMFSKTKGLMRAIAHGAKKPKSKLGARVQMFIANKLMMAQGRSFDTIQEALSINTFSKIRYNLDKLSYSMYIAELIGAFCYQDCAVDENYEEIYNLIFNVYDLISKAQKKEDIILYSIKFIIKFLNILGWGIDFNYCSNCQRKIQNDINKSSLFSFSEGGFLCDNCAINNKTNAIYIHNKIKNFLEELSKTEFSEKTKYDDIVNLAVLEKCFEFLKKYTANFTNKKTKIFEVLK